MGVGFGKLGKVTSWGSRKALCGTTDLALGKVCEPLLLADAVISILTISIN